MSHLKLYQLPEFESLAKSLHQGSAAVMVGSGFSRSAAVSAEPSQKMPLWLDFAYLLTGKEHSGESLLRLAEGYVALHKRQKLNQLIKEAVNDASWQPGELYEQLLKLPWAEVLTTNWDTLLERASKEITTQIYETVHYPQDLAQAKAPRLTKLHGTLGVTEHLIFTEEDYRTYPNKYAAFVNFARQVCIEKDLCLLGFSGTDPNFLAWIGWVRDHLKDQSRNIYLIGVLNLTSVTRRYYESLNITAIDLSEFLSPNAGSKDQQHLEGLKLTLTTLHKLKPKSLLDWQPSVELGDDDAANWLDEVLPKLKEERENYPGWLVCPEGIKQKLSFQVRTFGLARFWAGNFSPEQVAQLFYEIAWRYRLLNRPISAAWLEPILAVLEADEFCSLTNGQATELALAVLEFLQWQSSTDSVNQNFEKVFQCLERIKLHWLEAQDALCFWKAWLQYRKLDFMELELLLHEWQATQPMWQLRKAGLLATVGDFEHSALLVKKAYEVLKTQWRNNTQSIYLLSRLAWAHWFWRAHQMDSWANEDWPTDLYRSKQCEPWRFIEAVNNNAQEALQKQLENNARIPRFQPGAFQDKSQAVRFSNAMHPLINIAALQQATGVPLRLANTNLFSKTAITALAADGPDIDEVFWWAINSAHSETDEIIETAFSRINIAKLTEQQAAKWLDRAKGAMKGWLNKFLAKNDKHGFFIMRLRVLMEITARFAIRSTPEEAIKLFKYAVNLGHKVELHHYWLHKSLKNLLENAYSAIPENRQHEVLLDALCFPLETEIVDFMGQNTWPNIVVETPGKRENGNNKINAAVATLLNKAEVSNTLENSHNKQKSPEILYYSAPKRYSCTTALIRLLALHQANFLTEAEIQLLEQALWRHINANTELPATGLLSWTLLAFPYDTTNPIADRIRQYLYGTLAQQLDDRNHLLDVFHSATSPCKLLPTENQAKQLFEAIVEHEMPAEDTLGLARSLVQSNTALLSNILGMVIVPALAMSELNQNNLNKLKKYIGKSQVHANAMVGLVYFAKQGIESGKTENLLLRKLQEGHLKTSMAAARATLAWAALEDSQNTLPHTLIDQLINTLIYADIRSKAELLQVVSELQEKDLLTNQQSQGLASYLPILFEQMNYNILENDTYLTVNAPLIRRNVLLLAQLLVYSDEILNKNNLQKVLAEGAQDPLPEVRYIGNNN